MANLFRRQKTDVEALQKELQEKEEELRRVEEIKEKVLQDLNAIYLYAALSEEETQVLTLKEKQRTVMGICEDAMKKLS